MLVLTRKRNGSILIGSDITLTVRRIRADDVLLHVACPAETSVRTTGFQVEAAVEAPRFQVDWPHPPDAADGPSSVAYANLGTDQALLIGAEVTVTVLGLGFAADGLPHRVRLGIQAPRNLPVFRKEVLDKHPGLTQGR